MKGITSRWWPKRTDLHRSALLFILMPFLILMAGCTVDDPGYVITTEDSKAQIEIVDVDGDIVTIDSATEAIATIEYEHHEIHAGDSFSCWYMQEVSDTGDRSIVTFRTPNTTRWVHVTVTFSATVMAHSRIWEAPAVNDNTGAALPIYNRNRNSPTLPTVWDTSTNPDTQGWATYFTELNMGNVAGGTEIGHMHLGTGEGKKTVGGGARGQQEWILASNTLYAFEIESTNDDDNIHVIEVDWYEHTSR